MTSPGQFQRPKFDHGPDSLRMIDRSVNFGSYGNTQMAMTLPERRAAPRIDINGEIAYRTDETGEFRPGEIENLSIGGALIWIARELPVDSRLQIRTVPDHEDETVFQFEAIVLSRLRKQKGSMWGYSCRFELD